MRENKVIFVLVLILLVSGLTYFLSYNTRIINIFTGAVTSNNENANVSLVSSTPVVINVTNISTQSIVEAGMFGVQFNFTVMDADGTVDINNSQASGTVNLTGEASRSNSTCAKIYDVNSTVSTFWCNVTMFWFDGPGTWTINASIADNENNAASNNSINFTLSSTTAFVIAPSALTWPTVRQQQHNQTSNNDPIVLNNTGNTISSGINVTAYDLIGEIYPNQFINASNFTVGIVTSNDSLPNVECAASIAKGVSQMFNNTGTNISEATLQKGNFTINSGGSSSGQQSLYFCLTEVTIASLSGGIPQPLFIPQFYSTARLSAWSIRIG